MEGADSVSRRPRRKRRRWLLVILSVLVMGLVVCVAVYWLLSATRLDRMMSAAREAGQPLTLAELDA